jgi:bla regulator protein blaR1
MITFIIKSAVCLTVLYGFYHLFLRNINIFVFNRFYLLFSLLFSITIPFIVIRINVYLPTFFTIHESSNVIWQGEKMIAEPFHYLTFQNTLILFYFTTSAILFLRFVSNIYKIIRLIRTSSIVNIGDSQIVLVEKKTLPYSFFGYIFVNRSDYENDKIVKELIIHEQTHCIQYHSVDILVIEMIQIILWFNPLILFFRKAIQLNHEFLADNKVLLNHNLNDYQNTLVNLVLRNNSTYLASNFNYSLTKKRLIMMKKQRSKAKFIRIFMAIPLFLFLGLIMANANNSSEFKTDQIKQNDTITPPPPPPTPTKDKKEEKSDAVKGQSSVKDIQVKNENVTPPPPPPPVKKDQ